MSAPLLQGKAAAAVTPGPKRTLQGEAAAAASLDRSARTVRALLELLLPLLLLVILFSAIVLVQEVALLAVLWRAARGHVCQAPG